MNYNDKVPIIRIQHDQIILYEEFQNRLPRTQEQIDNEQNLTRGNYNGFMSPKTKSKVKKYLATWVESGIAIRKSVHKGEVDKIPYFTFITLTLPSKQKHKDNEIKRKLLTPYIQTLQRKFNVWHYFWRAEAQRNGNIHFHLIIDSYIHHATVRKEWNKCLNKLGYVDRFHEKHKHSNPNSTDIKSLKAIRSPASYLIKYCCKDDGYRPIKGRIHGCSDEIRTLTPYESLVDLEMDTFIYKAMEDEKTKVITEEKFTVIRGSTRRLMSRYYPKLLREMFQYKIQNAHKLYKINLPPDIGIEVEKVVGKKEVQTEAFSGSGWF